MAKTMKRKKKRHIHKKDKGTADLGEEKYAQKEELARQIVELRLSQKLTTRQIAERLGMNKSHVSRTLRDFARSSMARLGTRNIKILSRAEIHSKIHGYVPEALDKVHDLVDGAGKEEVQLAASKDILDRGGFKPIEKHMHIHAVEQMSSEQLREGFLSVMASIRERRETVIEVKPKGSNGAQGEEKK